MFAARHVRGPATFSPVARVRPFLSTRSARVIVRSRSNANDWITLKTNRAVARAAKFCGEGSKLRCVLTHGTSAIASSSRDVTAVKSRTRVIARRNEVAAPWSAELLTARRDRLMWDRRSSRRRGAEKIRASVDSVRWCWCKWICVAGCCEGAHGVFSIPLDREGAGWMSKSFGFPYSSRWRTSTGRMSPKMKEVRALSITTRMNSENDITKV